MSKKKKKGNIDLYYIFPFNLKIFYYKHVKLRQPPTLFEF